MADISDAKEKRAIKIRFHCFNATGQSIFVHGVSGTVSITRGRPAGLFGSSVPLDTPTFIYKQLETDHIPDMSGFGFSLSQTLPSLVLQDLEKVDAGGDLMLDLHLLDIRVRSHEDGSDARLKLWGCIQITKSAAYQTKRVRTGAAATIMGGSDFHFGDPE